jgi:hypothetical protein
MRTVEHLIESLSRLHEKKFFEISRNVLGDVKTPYHRQTVIERLISCISNAELQETLFSYITKDESIIINAVELLDEPCLHEIHDFLSVLFGYTECIRFLILLEERMILYSYISLGQEHYAVNPLFENMLKPILDNRSVLFPSVKKSGMRSIDPPSFTISKMFLFAFFSYVHSGKVHFKVNDMLTKKTENHAAAFFQDTDFFNDYFFNLLETSVYLDLLSVSEKVCVLNQPALEYFFKLSEIECRAYFAAGICGNKKCAPYVMTFLASLSPETYYTPPAIHRMLMIMFRKPDPNFYQPIDMFLTALKRTGLLIDVEDPKTGEKYYVLSSDCAPSPPAPTPIVFDSPFSFVLLPNTDIASVFDLIYFSSVENIREYRFVINREMVVRCLESCSEWAKGSPSKNAAWIVERLKTLSGNRLDETLVWTINEWEKRFGEVVLHEGLVLCLGKERRYLAETADLKPYLEKVLTDGVFIIDPAHRETVEKHLEKSGVDIIGRVRRPSPASKSIGRSIGRSIGKRSCSADALFPPLSQTEPSQAMFSPAFFTGTQKPHKEPVPATDYRKKFRAALELLDVAEEEKQELLLRIDRGLIFSEEQLKKLSLPGTFPYEKSKAHGMDYSGKLLIAKNAFINGIPVEITWQTDGKEKSLVCMIAGIEKNYPGDALVLFGDDFHDTLEIPLGKVSMIKKIKQSIFE